MADDSVMQMKQEASWAYGFMEKLNGVPSGLTGNLDQMSERMLDDFRATYGEPLRVSDLNKASEILHQWTYGHDGAYSEQFLSELSNLAGSPDYYQSEDINKNIKVLQTRSTLLQEHINKKSLETFKSRSHPEQEAERKRILTNFQNGTLQPEDAMILIDQFSKGEIDIGHGEENLSKMAVLLQGLPEDRIKIHDASVKNWFKNNWNDFRRGQKLGGLKRRNQKLMKLHTRNTIQTALEKAQYYGQPETDADKELHEKARLAQKDRVDFYTGGNFFRNAWRRATHLNFKDEQERLEALDPDYRNARIDKDIAFWKKISQKGGMWKVVKGIARQAERRYEIEKDGRGHFEKALAARTAKIERLKDKVAGSKWYENPWSKIALAHNKRYENRDLDKVVKYSLHNDLSKDFARLSAEIEALNKVTLSGNSNYLGTKAEIKRNEQLKAQKLKMLAKIEKKMNKLKNEHLQKSTKTENKFLKKEAKLEEKLVKRIETITDRSNRLEGTTFRGKAVERLLEQCGKDEKLRKAMEAMANGRPDEQITNDKEFVMLMTAKGFTKEEIAALQGSLNNYNTVTKKRVNKKDEPESEAPHEDAGAKSDTPQEPPAVQLEDEASREAAGSGEREAEQETLETPKPLEENKEEVKEEAREDKQEERPTRSAPMITDDDSRYSEKEPKSNSNEWHAREDRVFKEALSGYELENKSEGEAYSATLRKGEREVQIEKKNENIAMVSVKDKENGDKFPSVEEFRAVARSFKDRGEKAIQLDPNIKDNEFRARLIIAVREEGMEIEGFDKAKDLGMNMKDISPETKKRLHQQEQELGLVGPSEEQMKVGRDLSILRGTVQGVRTTEGKFDEEQTMQKINNIDSIIKEGKNNNDNTAYTNLTDEEKKIVDNVIMLQRAESKDGNSESKEGFNKLSQDDKDQARLVGRMLAVYRGTKDPEKKRKIVKRTLDPELQKKVTRGRSEGK